MSDKQKTTVFLWPTCGGIFEAQVPTKIVEEENRKDLQPMSKCAAIFELAAAFGSAFGPSSQEFAYLKDRFSGTDISEGEFAKASYQYQRRTERAEARLLGKPTQAEISKQKGAKQQHSLSI